jgi:hypothetical protein
MVRIIMGLYFLLRLLQMVIPRLFAPFRWALLLMGIAISTIRIGFPEATNLIADKWVASAMSAGFDFVLDTYIYYMIKVAAFMTIVIGWVLLSLFTVWIVKLLF